ncbi:MAG: zinc ribbon domain-containing protein [Methanobrevibacter sp.]|uniref:zinc ribbon domain-containing protein n=1 Tax=Methanobrevibacter sp. TaxID=66852 RepID=UPI0025E7C9DE|nr:zinc ribbon domain-containing protein [Methanobrevibacter sp.]MBE6507812.1 zinc ribbon domain-containing protein [Methanobrevibacter sp.]
MTKNCRKCGSEVQDDAKFCPNCGYDFDSFNKGGNSESKFNFSMLFVILIISILIIGSIFILTSGFGGDNKPQEDNVDHVILTIKEVNGYDVISGKTSYTLYTEALFDKVPSDMNGYNIKTTYYDKNHTVIGSEIEYLSYVYYDSEYPLSFGHYTTYKKPNPDYVVVEIIKDGKTIDNYTSQIDQGKIKFLN